MFGSKIITLRGMTPKRTFFPQFSKVASSGLFPARKIGVYVLTNYWSSHEEDLLRIYKLRILGYCPYVMIYDKQKFVDPKGGGSSVG